MGLVGWVLSLEPNAMLPDPQLEVKRAGPGQLEGEGRLWCFWGNAVEPPESRTQARGAKRLGL